MERLKVAQLIALGATVLTIVGIFRYSSTLMGIGFLLGIVSYIFGGFKKACSMGWRIAKLGFYGVRFPANIFYGFMTFVVAIVAFVYFPIIPVRKAYKESKKENIG